MPKFLDVVSKVRRIISRYLGSNTCRGHGQKGKANTQTNMGTSEITVGASTDSDSGERGIEILNHTNGSSKSILSSFIFFLTYFPLRKVSFSHHIPLENMFALFYL